MFIQAAAPTRSKLAVYSTLQKEAERLADDINARHGNVNYKPIILIVRHHEPDEVFELFRAADVCIVSSLHDGMNLVAKEFVASRDDEQGVLDPLDVCRRISRAVRSPDGQSVRHACHGGSP